MKKLSLLIVSGLLVLSLCACTAQPVTPSDGGEVSDEPSSYEQEVKLSYAVSLNSVTTYSESSLCVDGIGGDILLQNKNITTLPEADPGYAEQITRKIGTGLIGDQKECVYDHTSVSGTYIRNVYDRYMSKQGGSLTLMRGTGQVRGCNCFVNRYVKPQTEKITDEAAAVSYAKGYLADFGYDELAAEKLPDGYSIETAPCDVVNMSEKGTEVSFYSGGNRPVRIARVIVDVYGRLSSFVTYEAYGVIDVSHGFPDYDGQAVRDLAMDSLHQMELSDSVTDVVLPDEFTELYCYFEEEDRPLPCVLYNAKLTGPDQNGYPYNAPVMVIVKIYES